MSDPNEELTNLLTQTQKFLEQQRELFGDFLYRASGETPVESPKEPNEQAGRSIPVYAVPPEPLQDDLFGGPARQKAKMPERSAALLPYPNEPWVGAPSVPRLDSMINTCTKCSLGHTRKNFVFGVGNPKAEVVFIGEAPGADEDEQGEPFVGRAGQLLNKIIESIRFRREDVFICNILKCRPPNNRDPQPDEIDLCEPYLWKQLELINPKLILCLGRIAGQALLKTNASLSALRGKIHDYRGIKTMVTYHPAALLRNPNWKRPTWEDVQVFRKLYDEMRGSV